MRSEGARFRPEPRARVRVETQSSPPPQDRCQYDSGGIIPGEFVVSGGDATPVLEVGERPLDDIAPLVGVLIERMQVFPSWILFDYRCRATIGEERAKRIAVVGGITQQGLCRRQRFDQCGRRLDVMAVAAGQVECDDPAIAVDDRMYFRRPAAPTASDGLFFSPPFPPPAQR